MRIGPVIVAPLAACLALAAAFHTAAAGDKDMQRSITVSASGAVAAEPDMARITSGVTSEAGTAKEALSQNSQAMSRVIAGLKTAGIAAKDIQTSSFRIDPRYTRAKERQPSVIDGYRVTNQIKITVRNLDRLGEVLDQLVTLGANQMSGLTFEVSKAETLLDDARKEAVANALRRAKLYAVAADAEVGEVLSISEGAVGGGPRPVAMPMRAEAVPIERGTEMLRASVTITWALN